MYENLNQFDLALARLGDRVGIIAGLEISGKISPTDAYSEIKKLYKEFKKVYKSEIDE